jgi:hypothetical protein
MKEIIDKENMSEVHETISFACFFDVLFIIGNLQFIKSVSMILIEICPDICLRIPTGHILYHKISSCLLATKNLIDIDRSSILVALAGCKALFGVFFLHGFEPVIINTPGAVIATSAMRSDGAEQEFRIVDLASQAAAGV